MAPARDYALVINLSVLMAFILACVGGGWWWWTHRTNPKGQAEHYLHAIQWLDWGVVYDLSAEPPGGMKRGAFISKMDEPYEGNGVLRIGARHMYESITYSVGEPRIDGDKATVTATIGGRTLELKLKNFGGVWKVYPPSANPLSILMGAEDEDSDEKKAKADKALQQLMQQGNQQQSGSQ